MKYILLALCFLCGPAFGESPYQAIKDKDGSKALASFQDAIKVNIRPELRSELAPIVAAIRYSENGRAGREYGILHKRCPNTYRGQAGWAAATVQKNYDRWTKAGKKGEFISFLGARYCPLDDPRDKNGLNKHWVKNVNHFTQRFRKN